jgi:hypothetical protein
VNVDRKLDDATLMRYLDGELGPDEARDAERAVAADPGLQAKARALGQLGEVVSARYDHAADEVDARLAALWETIQPQLERRPAAAASPKEERPFWDWLVAYRSHFLTGAVAAAAGALIATFAARGGPHEARVPAPVTVAAEVESLEVANGSATVLQLPGERAGETTTMIWLTPAAAGTGTDDDEGPI